MCRLFGMTAGRTAVTARFWLLDAPDSLRAQSIRNPDGTGLGTFDAAGRPVVEKQPLPAWADSAFAAEAMERRSTTFVAHVRRSTGTPVALRNTHPFTLDGRIFAHNGQVGGLPELEAHLGADLGVVQGQTDSERYFALVTREIRRAGGDVPAGLRAALGWLTAHVPVTSANAILAAPGELWALRHPAARELWLLDRRTDTGVDHRSELGTRVRTHHAAPTVVIASEPMDGEGRWRPIPPGTLVYVDRALRITSIPLAATGA